MSRSVAFAVIMVINAILALVLTSTLMDGSGVGAVSASLTEQLVPSASAAENSTVQGVGIGFGGLTLSSGN
jgi:hypothetical protein